MNYLEKLKLLMKQHGLNENQLAKKANVPQSTINSLFQKNFNTGGTIGSPGYDFE